MVTGAGWPDVPVREPVERESPGLWVLPRQAPFAYSDGQATERLLARAVACANDLHSESDELATWIRDWPTAYHLSRKRAQLLAGFEFEASSRVLEVGCGCGAITRYLGECFTDVVAVEGSILRARIARSRTRDLENVSIVAAPFHEVTFAAPFDLVFCIGVLEYAALFIDAEDPYDAFLQRLREQLKPNGSLVIGIENQLGLKYFAGCPEDHTGIPFEGIEGYPRHPAGAKTFGYGELMQRVGRIFTSVEFLFPLPDYKMPDCIVSEEFLRVRRAEGLVQQFQSPPRRTRIVPVFDETLAVAQVVRNDLLRHMANSFLVVAHKGRGGGVHFPQLGITFNNDRRRPFRTVTRFLTCDDGGVEVVKTRRHGKGAVREGNISLLPIRGPWVAGRSVHERILESVKRRDLDLGALLAPSRPWLRALNAVKDAQRGKYVDAIWRNSFPVGESCTFVDQEWEWHGPLSLEALAIRAIRELLRDAMRLKRIRPDLRRHSLRRRITRLARHLGLRLEAKHFAEYCAVEAQLRATAFGGDFAHVRRRLMLEMEWTSSWRLLGALRQMVVASRDLLRRIQNRLWV